MMLHDLGDERKASSGPVGWTDSLEDLVKFAIKLTKASNRLLVWIRKEQSQL